MLFLVGVPMFFLEMILGQYAGLSATKIYARIVPGLRGLGYGMIIIPNIVNFYYVVVMAYAMYFFFAGMQTILPWENCQNSWNREHCYSIPEAQNCTDHGLTFFEQQCVDGYYFCEANNMHYNPNQTEKCYNLTDNVPFIDVTWRSPAAEEHWYHKVLGMDVENGHVNTDVSSWSHWGNIRWELVGCLFLSWSIICASLVKGVQSYGKVVYFTTLFPYVVLTILLGYVATLDGFSVGMQYYFVPTDWGDIYSPAVWNDAAGQIFYSLGVAVGSQLLLSSYNKFTANAHKDALLIGAFNSATSIYAGLVVFGSLGYIAEAKGVSIDKVIQAEAGLAFIVYPEAVSIMDVPQLFSCLFFIMLILLAVSSVAAQWEGLLAAFIDEYPPLKKKRLLLLIGSCFIAFLCGFAICFDSGFLLFTLMNNRCSNAVLLMAFIELIVVAWFYGSNKILVHVKEMGMELPSFMAWYWYLCWTFITPVIIGVVTVLAWASWPGDFFLDYTYPPQIEAIGWGLELVATVTVFLGSVVTVIKRQRAGKPVDFLRAGVLMSPNQHWGPRLSSGLPMPQHPERVNRGYEEN